MLLKKPASADDFFEGLTLLLNDGDTTNDYLDIYFQTLYPEFYDRTGWSSKNNWAGHTETYGGINWARQCKALVNVYLMYALRECRLQSDKDIIKSLNLNTGGSIFRSGGMVVFNNTPKKEEDDSGNLSDVQGGDVFIRNINGSLNHYGLYLDVYFDEQSSQRRVVIDANVRSDGIMRIGLDNENVRTEGRPFIRYDDKKFKVGRPE